MTVPGNHERHSSPRDLQLAALAELGQMALGGIALVELSEHAATVMLRVFPADRAAVLELHRDGSFAFRGRAGWPANGGDDPEPSANLVALARAALDHGGPSIRAGVPSSLTTPIGPAEAPWGALVLCATAGTSFTDDDATAVRSFANVLAGAARRLRSEQAIRQSEGELATVLAHVSDVIVKADPAGTIMFATPSAEQLLGFAPRALIGRNAFEFVHPDDFSAVEGSRRRALKEPGAPNAIECRLRHRNGSWVPVEAVGRGVRLAGGAFEFVVTVRDATARRKADALLRDREARLARQAQLFDEVQATARIGGWELDFDSGALYWTHETYVLHETSPEEYTPTLETAIAFYAEGSRQRIAEAVEESRRMGTGWDMELEIVTARGRRLAVRAVGAVDIVDRRPVRLYGAFQDLSERRELEEQFRQAQKMEAIGQLAGGIAHDFNNVLTVIQGHATLLESPGAVTSDLAESVQEIRTAADRAARLTRQLLLFSRRQAMNAQPLDLNEVVANIVTMLRRIVGEDVGVQLALADMPAMVHADSSMIEQVIMNLATNARDAMPRGGNLVIETVVLPTDAVDAPRPAPPMQRGWVCLRVRDTGEGIPPEIQARIFDPFFTTKGVGKGTGLGLANVHGIIQRHRGWVDLDSEPGRGTTFRIYLPGVAAASRAVEGAARPRTTRRGNETILFVEDEGPLRALGRMSLERLGYRVLEARSGVTALVVWEAHRAEISLLVTDVVMPGGMSGVDLARRLRAERPDLRVVCMSGYSDGSATADLERLPHIGFLAKPFAPADLAEAVERALDPSAGMASAG